MNGPEYSKVYNKPYCTDELYKTLKSLGSNTMTKLHKEEEFSKRHSKRLTERNIKNWSNPEYRKHHSENARQQWESSEYKEMMREIIKSSWKDETVRKKHCDSMKEFYQTEEGGRVAMSKMRGFKIDYNGIIFRSTWEVEFAKFLEKYKISYEYESVVIKYDYQGNTHNYFTDFYLPDYNLIVEVKADYQLDYEVVKVKRQATIDKGYNYKFITKEIISGLKEGSETIESRLLEEISNMVSE